MQKIITTLNAIVENIAARWNIDSHPTPWVIISIAIITTALTTHRTTWKPTRQVATIVHELGHTITAMLTGRKVRGIALHTDTSGVTTSEGKNHGIGFLLTVLSGYTAPPALGLGMIWAATHQYSGAALTIFTVLMLLAFWLANNIIGYLCTLLAAVVTTAIWWQASPTLTTNTTLAIGTFMVIAGVRCCLDLYYAHKNQTAPTTDATQAADLTYIIPAPLWVLAFIGFSIYCAAHAFLILCNGLFGA